MVPERGSKEARQTWAAADLRVSSILLYPETRSALARAKRGGRIRTPQQLTILRRLIDDLWEDVYRIEVTEEIARGAGELAEMHGLRAYDAVHLASADTVGEEAVLVAKDGALLAAARERGLETVPLAG